MATTASKGMAEYNRVLDTPQVSSPYSHFNQSADFVLYIAVPCEMSLWTKPILLLKENFETANLACAWTSSGTGNSLSWYSLVLFLHFCLQYLKMTLLTAVTINVYACHYKDKCPTKWFFVHLKPVHWFDTVVTSWRGCLCHRYVLMLQIKMICAASQQPKAVLLRTQHTQYSVLRTASVLPHILSSTFLICFTSVNYLLCLKIKFHPSDIHPLCQLIQVIWKCVCQTTLPYLILFGTY